MTEKYSRYELVSPSWLDKNFIEKILRDYDKDDKIEVKSLDITPATLSNDHYGSVMYRTKVKYQNSKKETIPLSLIVKTLPEDDSPKKEMLSDTFIFRTEIRMYSETLPKMEAILRKYEDDTVLGAKVYYAAMKPHEVLVFEDLVAKGYKTIQNRFPNEEEVKKALMKIAKWHAVSYILAKEDPESVTTYNDGTFTIDLSKVDMFQTAVKDFIKHVISLDDELKPYTQIFEKLDKVLLDKCVDIWNAYKRGTEALFVLNHGDFHFKNMMFKHKDNEQLDDLMLVDFQTCYYGPSATDLIYSTYMLMDDDIRSNRRDEMIYYYFTIFTESLKKFEFKGEIPKMADLQIDLIKFRAFDTFLVIAFLPLVCVFNDNSVDLENVIESTDYRTKLLSNPVLLKLVKKILPISLHKGNFDL